MKYLLSATILLLFQSRSHADLPVQAMADNCRTCHRQVSSELTVPDLAQLTVAQIDEKLLAFKYDQKSATLMPRLAKGYSDEELRAVASILGKH